MENAAKALLIAGGVLISILVIGAFIFLFRDISKTQVDLESSKELQQIDEFNKQFTSYEKTLYGHELLSLMNKMEENNVKIKERNLGYDYMQISVQKIKFTPALEVLPNGQYNNIKPGISGGDKFKTLIEIKDEMENRKFFSMTDADRDRLIELWGISSSDSDYVRKKAELDKLLNEYKEMNGFKTIKEFEIALQGKENFIRHYKDYVDFKRAKFKCKDTQYDNKTGRVYFMTFEMI